MTALPLLAHLDSPDAVDAPLSIANGQILAINATWRIRSDDIQWVLERRNPKPRPDGTARWHGLSWCTTRSALIRCIAEKVDDVPADALAAVEALPSQHPGYLAYVAEASR